MPKCPFAVWKPISGSSGSYLGGPAKIVHHTTEGSTAAGAMGAYATSRSDPHFTVDATTIYQHIDTNQAARSLKNPPGGVQTNRDSAIQIEVVGFAAKPKNLSTLANVAKLCRWIEANHGVAKVWPNGAPKTAIRGRDPGGHNRNKTTWDTKGGHYGHCHVPENDHWDPGYTSAEVALIMGSTPELHQLQEEWGFSVTSSETFNLDEPTELEIDNIKLITYSVTVSLDDQGQGETHLDIAAERVSSLIAQAVKLSDGRTWDICKVGLAEDKGRTLLVASGGKPNTEITVFVKVLETVSLQETSTGCPSHDETVENETQIELEQEEFECEAPASKQESLPIPEAGPPVNVQLPASGQGYYSYSANRNKQYGLAKTIDAIKKIGRDWFSTHSAGPVIGIGNISLNGGGQMPPHQSHQRGLDVDFRLLRKDGARVGVSRFDAAYSRQRTQDLVNVIRANGVLTVDLILFNDTSVTGVQSWPGHDDHLHVRFR